MIEGLLTGDPDRSLRLGPGGVRTVGTQHHLKIAGRFLAEFLTHSRERGRERYSPPLSSRTPSSRAIQ